MIDERIASALQVRVLRTQPELDELHEEWNETLAASSADCLFLTWEWLNLWWNRLGADRNLHIIEVRDQGKLLGLAPLTESGGRLEFMGAGIVGSDYLDLIVRKEREDETIAALARSIAETGLHARLSHFSPGSAVHRLALQLAGASHYIFERVVNVCPYMSLADQSWEAFVSSLGSRHRENLRRRIRKLPKDFTFDLTTTETDLRNNFPALIELHRQRWEGRGGSDAFAAASVQAFHREFSLLALQRGWLRLFILNIDARPAAAVYAFHRNGKTLYYQAGVASEHGDKSLGLVALGLSIRHAIEEHSEEFDLLHGDETYKSLWTRRTRDLRLAALYPRSLGGRLTMHSHAVLRVARRMARYVIKRSPQRAAQH